MSFDEDKSWPFRWKALEVRTRSPELNKSLFKDISKVLAFNYSITYIVLIITTTRMGWISDDYLIINCAR